MAQARREESYGRGLARAFAGAVIFGFPLVMTMEMWELGFYMDRLKLAVFIAVICAVVYGLSVFSGFRRVRGWREHAMDTLAALMVGMVASAALLAMLGLVTFDMPLREIIGKIAVQSAPAGIGAILANKQLHGERDHGRPKGGGEASYVSQVFLMGAGALFLIFNVAPTEEMILIGFRMSGWHAAAVVVASLAMLHALVFTVGFAGQERHDSPLGAFFHFTLAGYGLVLVISVYILWTFGRLEGAGLEGTVRSMVVLSLPGSLGAAAARLLV